MICVAFSSCQKDAAGCDFALAGRLHSGGSALFLLTRLLGLNSLPDLPSRRTSTLAEAAAGERIELIAVSDQRYARSLLLIGLLDKVVMLVHHRVRDGGVVIEYCGQQIRVPGHLARAVIYRRISSPDYPTAKNASGHSVSTEMP